MAKSRFELHLPEAWAKEAGGNLFRVAGQLVELAKDKLQTSPNLPPRDAVTAAAGVAYDKYIAPIDIPVVPNMVEPLVDAQLKLLFVDAVGRIYDAIAKPPAPPTPPAP